MFCPMSAIALVRVKIWLLHVKALEMRIQKLVLDLSVDQILHEKINKMFLPKKLGFIDVLPTVRLCSISVKVWKRTTFCRISRPAQVKAAKYTRWRWTSQKTRLFSMYGLLKHFSIYHLNNIKLIWIYGREKKQFKTMFWHPWSCKVVQDQEN